MHAPELHGTALLQPCILLYAPECTFAEQSVNEHRMSVVDYVFCGVGRSST